MAIGASGAHALAAFAVSAAARRAWRSAGRRISRTSPPGGRFASFVQTSKGGLSAQLDGRRPATPAKGRASVTKPVPSRGRRGCAGAVGIAIRSGKEISDVKKIRVRCARALWATCEAKGEEARGHGAAGDDREGARSAVHGRAARFDSRAVRATTDDARLLLIDYWGRGAKSLAGGSALLQELHGRESGARAPARLDDPAFGSTGFFFSANSGAFGHPAPFAAALPPDRSDGGFGCLIVTLLEN